MLTVVTKNYGLSLEWIGYSRKDFKFPTDQVTLAIASISTLGNV